MAFAHSLSGRNHQLVADAGDERSEIGSQFLDRVWGAVAGNDEDLSQVVVKKHGQDVPSGELIALPRSLDRPGAEHLEARAVDVGENIERPLVIADARRPDAPAVDVPPFQAIRWAEV